MAEEKLQVLIWTGIIAAVTGIYGFFVRHIVGHPDRDEISTQLQKLWDEKQSTKTCDQIVTRIDENHKETCKKLDRILDAIQK